MISKSMSHISCDKEQFDKASLDYNNALNKSRFNEKRQYTPTRLIRRNRQRNKIWFNPPFSENFKTDVGKTFPGTLEKHLSKHIPQVV